MTVGVSYSAMNDRLCLDGQRLLLVSGSYGVTGAIYRTEVDSYARITQIGVSGKDINDAGTCFRVEQKDGRVLHSGGVTGAMTNGALPLPGSCTISATAYSR